VRTVLLRSWVRCLFARPACDHVTVLGVHGPTGTQDCSAGPETLRAHITDVVTTSNTRCTSLRCFLPPSLQEQWRRRKTRRSHRNSRGQWSPTRATLGRTDVDIVVHLRRGPPLDDGARASCRAGPHAMHCVTLGRRRAALKWSRISCSKSDFFGSFLPTCGCR
jgi:hypothetical protein